MAVALMPYMLQVVKEPLISRANLLI